LWLFCLLWRSLSADLLIILPAGLAGSYALLAVIARFLMPPKGE